MTISDKNIPYFPIPYDVEEGESYRWCGCGETNTKPFCDKDNCGNNAVFYKANLTETLYFCGCRETKDPPFCDGSHGKLLFKLGLKTK